MNQYQKEYKAVKDAGGDLEKFDREFMARAVKSYKRNVKSEDDLNEFRKGNIKV